MGFLSRDKLSFNHSFTISQSIPLNQIRITWLLLIVYYFKLYVPVYFYKYVTFSLGRIYTMLCVMESNLHSRIDGVDYGS